MQPYGNIFGTVAKALEPTDRVVIALPSILRNNKNLILSNVMHRLSNITHRQIRHLSGGVLSYQLSSVKCHTYFITLYLNIYPDDASKDPVFHLTAGLYDACEEDGKITISTYNLDTLTYAWNNIILPSVIQNFLCPEFEEIQSFKEKI